MSMESLLTLTAAVRYKSNLIIDAATIASWVSGAASLPRIGVMTVSVSGISGTGTVTVWGTDSAGAAISEGFSFSADDLSLGQVEFSTVVGASISGIFAGVGTLTVKAGSGSGQPIEVTRTRNSAWKCRISTPKEYNVVGAPGILAQEGQVIYGVPETINRNDTIYISGLDATFEALESGRTIYNRNSVAHHVKVKVREIA